MRPRHDIGTENSLLRLHASGCRSKISDYTVRIRGIVILESYIGRGHKLSGEAPIIALASNVQAVA